jgi:hypothetical protein
MSSTVHELNDNVFRKYLIYAVVEDSDCRPLQLQLHLMMEHVYTRKGLHPDVQKEEFEKSLFSWARNNRLFPARITPTVERFLKANKSNGRIAA